MTGLPCRGIDRAQKGVSQAARSPMLLFEFEAALFQFEQREPEFDPLFQLPPKSEALFPGLPLLFLSLYPGIDHSTYLGYQSLGDG